MDVLHFVDNTSALAGFIKGAGGPEDSCAIFSIYHILAAELGLRIWAEHVEGDGNCADPPSRGGVDLEKLVANLGADFAEKAVPDIADLYSAPLLLLLHAFGG